jgi:hypothetical protein
MINQNQYSQSHPSSTRHHFALSNSSPRGRKKAWCDERSALLWCINLYPGVLFSVLLLLLCACNSVTSPAQTSTTASTTTESATATSIHSTSLTQVDWMNYTYTSSCYSNTRPFQVRHGVAVNNGIHFTVYKPYYGDLTGDAKVEAIIPYQCSAVDTTGKHVFIYSGTAAHPVLLADLPEAGAGNTIDNVIKISIGQGELQLAGIGYSAGTPRCCPDLSIQNSYRWNGSKFMLLRSIVNKR